MDLLRWSCFCRRVVLVRQTFLSCCRIMCPLSRCSTETREIRRSGWSCCVSGMLLLSCGWWTWGTNCRCSSGRRGWKRKNWL